MRQWPPRQYDTIKDSFPIVSSFFKKTSKMCLNPRVRVRVRVGIRIRVRVRIRVRFRVMVRVRVRVGIRVKICTHFRGF